MFVSFSSLTSETLDPISLPCSLKFEDISLIQCIFFVIRIEYNCIFVLYQILIRAVQYKHSVMKRYWRRLLANLKTGKKNNSIYSWKRLSLFTAVWLFQIGINGSYKVVIHIYLLCDIFIQYLLRIKMKRVFFYLSVWNY